jgi:hypothetical protein
VACPARGTILASGRVDRYLSLIGNLIEHIPLLADNPIAALFKAMLFALVKQRADPRHIPGLEAQMPESPLIHLLNRPSLKTNSDLGVIAGDRETVARVAGRELWAGGPRLAATMCGRLLSTRPTGSTRLVGASPEILALFGTSPQNMTFC